MDEWISTQAASVVLRITTRQVQRYAQTGRLRSRRVGQRLQVHQDDVRTLATELDSSSRQPVAQVIPADVLMGYVDKLRIELEAKSRELGRLEERPLLADYSAVQHERDMLREQVATLEQQVKELKAKIKPSLWDRLRGKG